MKKEKKKKKKKINNGRKNNKQELDYSIKCMMIGEEESNNIKIREKMKKNRKKQIDNKLRDD
jgi:hypothetical protein